MAETSTNIASPPYSSGIRPYSVSWPRTLVGVGVRLVDLVDRDHDRHVGSAGVVERLDRLRHDAVVGRDDQDRDVGGLGTTSTHGGERLVTGGVDEGDATVVAVDLGVDLVGTDVLGDATGLLVDHVGVAQRVEELGLSVVDVTHDGHDRRTDHQVVLVALVGAELEVERLEQLAVLVLGGDDLDDVVELLADQLEGLVADRLGRGDHLTEREQHLDQGGRVDVDLLGEVGQGRAARETYGLAVALADAHAADRRGLHGLELHTTRTLRLATSTRRATSAPEGTLGLATLAGATDHRGDRRRRGRSRRDDREHHRERRHRERRRDDPERHRGRERTGAPPGPPPGPPRAGRAPGPLPKAAGDLGIIAGLGRGMPGRASPPAAGGRGGRLSSGRERPMPWLGAKGLLPGRGAPGRPTGRGAGVPALAAGAWGSDGVSVGCLGGGRLGLRDGSLGAGLRAGAGAGGGRRRCGLGGGLGDRLGGGRLDRCLDGRFGRCSTLGAGLGRCLLGRRCLGVGGGSGGRSGLQLVAVLLLEAHLDGGLDSRRCRLDELTHLLELLENELALDSELLGEFVDSGLCHGANCSFWSGTPEGGEADQLVGVQQTHSELLIECS